MISAIKKAVAKVYDPYVAARQAFMDASIYPKGERQMSSVLDVLSQEQIRVSVLELLQTERLAPISRIVLMLGSLKSVRNWKRNTQRAMRA